MPNNVFLPIIHIGLGIMLIVIGYLMKVKQWSGLIAGYNTASKEEKEKYDTKALCKGVGNFMYILGFTLFLASFGSILKTIWIMFAGWGLFFVATVVFLVYANTGGRYKK